MQWPSLTSLLACVLCQSLLPHGLLANEDAPLSFTPEVQLRPRWEADSGRDGDPDAGSVSYVTMRTRLGGSLSYGGATGRVVISDVRLFGEETDTRRDFAANGLDVRIATLTYAPGPLSVTIGRMETSLHNERLLAIANWRQPGRSFDGGYLRYDAGAIQVESWALLISEGDIATFETSDQVVPGGDDGIFTVLSPSYRGEWGVIRPLVIYDANGNTGIQRITYGLHGEGAIGAIRWGFEAYGQGGRSGESSLGGAMAHVAATYAPDTRFSPTLTLWYDFLRGDDTPDDGRLTTFNTLYGANHKYYGHIDMAMFFVGGFKDTLGLQDAALKGRISPMDRLTLGLDLHGFFAAQASNKRLLAIEPDLSFKVALQQGLSLIGGVNLWLPPSNPEGNEWMGWMALDLRLP